ncbi:hypothetical protein CXF83_14865 [Shewanella sp. Choline-02u-19]|nr:hypothetical protein CXF84_11575 [Shewanella sp. Bg11-22]PKI27901.1 hypothetical protein CXF83_14865 [Shewanella sp. Choline-02u-19]
MHHTVPTLPFPAPPLPTSPIPPPLAPPVLPLPDGPLLLIGVPLTDVLTQELLPFSDELESKTCFL